MRSILILFALVSSSFAAELRIGMIGLDTSHVPAMTELINNPKNPKHVSGGKVVAAFKGGSPDLNASASRVGGFTKTLREKYHVEIVPSIEALCAKVDVVMLMSVDGRPHLEQARPVIEAKKTLYIDKPIAASLRDTLEIFRLAKEATVPVFSSSSYRFYDSMIALQQADVGEIKGAISFGPCTLEKTHPDLFWYGVHSAEALFTVMGTGCESVVRISTPDTDVVEGVWKGGRIGTFRGLRGGVTPHKVILFGSKGVAEQAPGQDDYAPLVVQIMSFFQTGVAPVKPEETIELFAFMEAADESKREGGKPVRLTDVMKKAGAR
jgi:hypothetical protein